MNSRMLTRVCHDPGAKFRHAASDCSLEYFRLAAMSSSWSSVFRLLHQLALELLRLRDREILNARIQDYIASMPTVWRAIISSSFVGIAHAETRLDRVPTRDSPPSFAVASSSTPSHAASRQTRSRTAALFSPMPAVNTIASRPPSAL